MSGKSNIPRRRRRGFQALIFTCAVLAVTSGCARKEPEKNVAALPTPTASASASGAAGSGAADPAAYVQCMRANGVPNLPDPGKNGELKLSDDLDPESPAFKKAEAKCIKYMGSDVKQNNGTAELLEPNVVWSDEDKLKYAACMRTNGVPGYPDPDKTGNMALPEGTDPESQAFKKAEAACQKFMPGNIPNGQIENGGNGTQVKPGGGS